MADWSLLPNDVLEHITSFLPLQDYIRFGAVCRSWLYVAGEKHQSPASQLPWVVFSDDIAIGSFFNLSEQKVYHIDLPEGYGRRCCGSSHGWLVTIDEMLEIHLLNPFSRARIQLPSLLRYSDNVDLTEHFDIDLVRELKLRDRFICKAILSADPRTSSNYIVMAIYGNTNRLAFWRPGDERWTELKHSYGRCEDVIWYKGQFYAVTATNRVLVVDIGPDPRVRGMDPRVGSPYMHYLTRYLVDLEGDLLLVLRDIKDEDDAHYNISWEEEDFENLEWLDYLHYKTTAFVLFKFDLIKDKWVQLNGIGDYALFLGINSSMSVSAPEFPECKKNSIYFTDDYDDGPLLYGDTGIYNLGDGSFQPYYAREGFHTAVSPPIWLNPNPW